MNRLNISGIYNTTDASIHSCRYWFSTQIPDEGRVLDAACGFGYGCKLIRAACPNVELIGLDRDPEAIEFASTWLEIQNSQFTVFDLERQSILEKLGAFDTIICIDT